jgi:hypothetical protein
MAGFANNSGSKPSCSLAFYEEKYRPGGHLPLAASRIDNTRFANKTADTGHKNRRYRTQKTADTGHKKPPIPDTKTADTIGGFMGGYLIVTNTL